MKSVYSRVATCVIPLITIAQIHASEGGERASIIKPPKSAATSRFVELKGVKWKPGQTIRILFMEGTDEERQLVRETAVEWTKYANLKFEFYDSPEALGGQQSDIRITFNKNDGSHSAIGNQARYYGQDESTMNFGWNTKTTILHEFGHALGLKHEHQNPSAGIPWKKDVIYAHFAKQGWSREKVDQNVFAELDKNTVNYSVYDKKSIMVYEYPPEWTTDASWAKRGDILSELDKAGIAKMYPGKTGATNFGFAPTAPPTAPATPATPAAPAVTPTVTPAASGSFQVGATVQCGNQKGTITRMIKNSLFIKLSNGKLWATGQKNCKLADAGGSGATGSPVPVEGTTGSAREGDRVSCNGVAGTVVRTIGDNVLVDLEGGKREMLTQSQCSVQ